MQVLYSLTFKFKRLAVGIVAFIAVSVTGVVSPASADYPYGPGYDPSGRLAGWQIAQVAYNAGFRGDGLRNIVAISWRESNWTTNAVNPSGSAGLYQFLGHAQCSIGNGCALDAWRSSQFAFQFSAGGTLFWGSARWASPPNADAYSRADAAIRDLLVTIAKYSTPPSPMAGKVDSNSCSRVTGWSVDSRNLSKQTQVHLYFYNSAGAFIQSVPITANVPRPDVTKATGAPGNHGFDITVPDKTRGQDHAVIVYSIDPGGNHKVIGGGVTNGCATRGSFDSASCTNVTGWAFDPTAPGINTTVHVYIKNLFAQVDSTGFSAGPTNVTRSDVNAMYKISGTHGFNYKIPDQFKNKPIEVTVYAIGRGGNNVKLGWKAACLPKA